MKTGTHVIDKGFTVGEVIGVVSRIWDYVIDDECEYDNSEMKEFVVWDIKILEKMINKSKNPEDIYMFQRLQADLVYCNRRLSV